jgi:drug/metabolite transporter (DMT)-like permease
VHTCWLAAAQLTVLGALTEGPAAVTELRLPHVLAMAHLALVVTALAFVLWYSAVGRIGSARAGLLTGVAPVAAAAVGVLLGSALPGPGVWAGIALVATGLVVGVRSARRPGRAQSISPGRAQSISRSRPSQPSASSPGSSSASWSG